MPEFEKVASVPDLTDGSCLRVEVRGRAIALINVAGNYFAVVHP